MLVVDLRNTRINVYNYSVVGNKNSDIIYFYYPKKYQDYDVYVKVLGENIADKFRIYTPNIEVKDDCIRAKWIMSQSVTVNKEIQVQLEYNITLLGGGEIAQSKIVTLKLQNTLDIEGSVEPVYPSILQELREDLDAEILNREQGDTALHNEIVAEKDRAESVEAGLQTAINGKVDKVEGKGLSTNDYTDADKNKLAGVEAGAQANVLEGVKVNGQPLTPTNKEVNIDLTPYALINDMQTYGKSLAVSIDPQTFVLTMSLKDANGNTLNTQTVDLPLETMVVSGSYDDTTKSLILVLKNGQTITIPVADLVVGLVSETQLTQVLQSYYTKTEMDTALNTKADKTQTEADLLKAKYHLGVADTVAESNGITTITRKTGYLDLGDLDWTYDANNHYFFASFNGMGSASGACSKYIVGSYTDMLNNDKTMFLANSINYIYVHDNDYTDATTFKSAVKGVKLEYETVTSYTEQVPTDQPLNTLDKQGSEFVRKEWEKTQNLYSGSQSVSGNDTTFVLVELPNPITLKAGTYRLSANTTALHPFVVFYNGTADVGEFFLRNEIVIASDITVDKIRFYYDGNGGTSGAFSYTNIMLNEGDHPYPYQPYNGAIVHEKDIENVARTDRTNNFEYTQNIRGTDDTCLVLQSRSTVRSNIMFGNSNTVQLGNIGFNSSYKPEAYTPTDGTWHLIMLDSDITPIQDLLAELKTIVYDNQYPAVAEIDLTYATYYALPSQISGDKIIMSAGMDMTKVKGRSYVVNQMVETMAYTSGTINAREYQDLAFPKVNGLHKVLLIISSKITSANANKGVYMLIGHNAQSEYTDKSATYVEGKTFIIGEMKNYAGYNSLIVRLLNTDNENSLVFQDANAKLVDLTQWFGSNDAIPSDLLADPSLFTKKYWKKDLPYDTGHIEDSKPVKVIATGFNKWDEELENGAYSISNGSKSSAPSGYMRSKNFIKVIPNTTYYRGINYWADGRILFYDKDKNFISSVSSGSQGTFATPLNCYYITFFLNYGGTTYNHDICINISDPLLNGKYLPFEKHEYPIIPIDMGTYTFTGNETLTEDTFARFIFSGLASSVKRPLSSSEVANATLEGFNITSKATVEIKPYQFAINNDGTIYFHLESGTTQAEALAYLTGRTLVYELATQSHNPLRSAGSVQDDNEKVNVGVVDLGTLGWLKDTTTRPADGATVHAWYTQLDGCKTIGYGVIPNMIVCGYETTHVTNVDYGGYDVVKDKLVSGADANNHVWLYNTAFENMTQQEIQSALSGVYLYYELATPTEQSPAITLPENIEIQKGGTIEIEYDDGYSTPCDADFEVAVSKVLEE